MHEGQLGVLQPVEVVDRAVGVRHARDGGEREEGLAGEVVGGQHVVVHHGEQDHGAIRPALLQCHRAAEQTHRHDVRVLDQSLQGRDYTLTNRDLQFEALVEDRVERLLVNVGRLLRTVREYPPGDQLNDHEGVAEACSSK